MGDRAAAVAFFNQGVTSSNDKTHPTNIAHAYQQFMSACYADPTWWMAHYQAGNNAFDLKFFKPAAACQRRALECEHPKEERGKILSNLGMILYELGEIEEARQVSQQAVDLDNTLVSAWQNLSCIYGLQGYSGEAVTFARNALAWSSDHERTLSEALLSFALLFDRQYAEGFRMFECRFRWRLHNFLAYPYVGGSWQGQADTTIFLVADQGLGDTLSFARFVPLAAKRAKYIHACVQPELMRLFQHAFINLPNVNLMPSPSPFPQADHWSTFVSLPFALGLTDDEIRNTPQVEVPVFPMPTTWKVPDRKFHIGIAWSGSKMNDIDRHRNIPVEQFLELYRVPGIQLYGLQVDGAKEDLHQRGCAPLIRDLSGFVSDVTSTLSILPHLDLVITCESALGHICSAIGKECWVPYSAMGHDYRLGHLGDDILWSPNHRVFKQDLSEKSWQPVFERVIEALREKVDGLG